MRTIASGLALAAIAVHTVWAAPAAAQTVCGPRDSLVAHLGQRHGEAPAAMGAISSDKMIEVLASEAGTWTIIVTDVNGRSCLLAAGEGWQTIAPPAADGPGA